MVALLLTLDMVHHIIKSDMSRICPGLNANEIQIAYDKHHKLSSLVKSHQNTHHPVNIANVNLRLQNTF